jgi:hypothetical protein
MGTSLKTIAVLAITLILAACGGTYRTYYEAPVDASVSRTWRVVDVAVRVPDELTVSEERSLVPRADIVWREDPPGDRKAQIAAVLRDAIGRGAAPLRGGQPVRFVVTVQRFHALTFEAETRLADSGVHNVHFDLAVVDARTGAVIRGPERIEADVPAFSGPTAIERRRAGETQRSVITNHVASVIQGWLGIGPDRRGSFNRLGD